LTKKDHQIKKLKEANSKIDVLEERVEGLEQNKRQMKDLAEQHLIHLIKQFGNKEAKKLLKKPTK